jgi:DNA-binding response OmpR family regulator
MSRILIVQDDPAILCGLKDSLEFESHQVLTADAAAGYRTQCEHSPDLVILDLVLPKLTGYDRMQARARLFPRVLPNVPMRICDRAIP